MAATIVAVGALSLASVAVLPGVAYADTLPGAPKGVSATTGNSQATVKWTAGTNTGSALTGYVVTPYVSGVAQAPVSFGSTATTEVVTGLTNGVRYTFAVAAVNGAGQGPNSAQSSSLLVGTPGSATSPMTIPGDSSATVTWIAPVDNGSPINYYVVTPYVGTTAGTAVAVPAPASNTVLTGLTNGTTYSFRIAAVNSIGIGPTVVSQVLGGGQTCIVGLPAQPATVTAAGAEASATISWTAAGGNGSPITGYVVTPVLGSVLQAPITFNDTATTQVISGLADSATLYTFRVAGTNQYGSGIATASNAVLVGPTAAPMGVTAVAGTTPGTATVKWGVPSSPGSPITSYVVTPYISGVAQATQTFGAGMSGVVTGLANNTIYTFSVSAVNSAGASPQSAQSAPLLTGMPGAPSSVIGTSLDVNVSLHWMAPGVNPGSVTGYIVTPYLGSVAQTPITFASTATTQLITGLTVGSTYTFKVAATAAVGSGPQSTPSAAVLVGVPLAPTGVTASGGNNQATVSWTAPAGTIPITAYVVTPYIGSTAQTPQVFNSSATTEVPTGLTNGSSYTFRVAARNAYATGPTATSNSVLVGPTAAPTNVTITGGNGQATIKWTAPASVGSPITGYLVTPAIGGVAQSPITVGTTSPQVVPGLSNGTTYTFSIQSVNGAGPSPSSASTAAVLIGAPNAPTNLMSTVGNGQVTLKWMAPATNGLPIIGYLVTPYISGVAQTPVSYGSTAITEVVTGLTNGTAYTFTVAALVSGGNGPQSAVMSAVVIGAPLPPTSVMPVNGNGQITLNWTAAGDNGSPISGYVITPYIGSVAQAAQSFGSTTPSEVVTGLSNGVTYTFKVAAVNGNGVGYPAASAAILVGAPGVPTGTFASGGPAAGQATVSWVAPADNGSAITSYIITPYLSGVAQAAQTFASNATTEVVTGLTSGKTYTFKIQAVNGIGAGTVSPVSMSVLIP